MTSSSTWVDISDDGFLECRGYFIQENLVSGWQLRIQQWDNEW